MAKLDSVYVMTDLEGVAGIDDWDPRHRDDASTARGVRDREEMQRLLTGEVCAAIEGLQAAGVRRLVVNDAHGAGRTILAERLPPAVCLARGTERGSWVMGLEPGCQALVQVGMHAMARTPGACLCHTMSSGYVYRVNGVDVGEMELCAYLLGEFGIPWVFVSGDGHACREAERFVPGIVTVAVKEGHSLKSAVHLSPAEACARIRSAVQEAVARADRLEPLRAPRPTTMEIVRDEPWPREIRAGAQRVDAFTVRYEGPNIWQVFNHHFYGRPDLPPPMQMR